MKMKFDNHDERIKYYEIVLYNNENKPFTEYPLPNGYKFVFYKDGDRDKWIEIETSAKEFKTYEDGLAAWNKWYSGKETDLFNRMFFIENSEGEKIATATAFYEPTDLSGAGWLHWVAVKRDHQGKGLARPLISHTLNQLRRLGYTIIKIPTQTTTWVAAKLYLDFGFKPIPKNAVNSYDGYRILKTLTNHPALKGFPSAEPYEILNHK